MFRRRRGPKYDATDRIRQGTGPLDNLVVLIGSLALLVAIGLALLWYSYA